MEQPIITLPKRPKWNERQRIGASDLSAEQAWQDAQLTRLRRMAMGWGVVAGFEVSRFGNHVRIGAGYGITAAGSEVYLAEETVLANICGLVCKTCGGEAGGCGDLTGVEAGPVTAWLVLRPQMLDACPRPTVPEGCDHPASASVPARQVQGLVPEIHCDLADHLTRQDPVCDTVEGYLDALNVPVPAYDDDILPLAKLTCSNTSLDAVDMSKRRKLLPLWALQDVLACCECHEPDDTTDPPPAPPAPDDTIWTDPTKPSVGELIDDIFGAFKGGEAATEIPFGDLLNPLYETLGEELIFKKAFLLKSVGAAFGVKGAEGLELDQTHLLTFGASLLVWNVQTIEAIADGDWLESFRQMKALASALNAGAVKDTTVAGIDPRNLNDAVVRFAWEQGKDGFKAVQDVLGAEPGSVLATIDPKEAAGFLEEKGSRAQAAALWLRRRILFADGGK